MRRLAESARPRSGRAARCVGNLARVQGVDGGGSRPFAHADGMQDTVAGITGPEGVCAAYATKTDDTLEHA